MPPKKLPASNAPRNPQAAAPRPAHGSSEVGKKAVNEKTNMRNHDAQRSRQQPQIPEQDIKQSSSVSAGYALEAGKKAYQLRQAAAAAGDPDAREELLGKAINKEIEAESFGKAAKYTRSGAFQGLAAGAGVGIQPGATVGKLTGALVGGLLSTVGGLLGGGVGAAYGAISGPMWDLGAMASHGVRNVVGDFIGDWPDTGTSTKHQKETLEKMVLGAQKTKMPSESELEEMQADDGGAGQESYQQFAKDMTAYLPSMDSMPNWGSISRNMPAMPGMSGVSQGISGLSSSVLGSGGQTNPSTSTGSASASAAKGTSPPSHKQQSQQPSQRTQQPGRPPKLDKRSQPTRPAQQASTQEHQTTDNGKQKPATASTSQSANTNKPPKLGERTPRNNPAAPKPSTAAVPSKQQQASSRRPPPPKLGPRKQSTVAVA